MLRTRLARVLMTASFVLAGMIATGAPANAGAVAQASAVTVVAQASAVTVSETATITPLSEWRFAGYYNTLRECKDEGDYLISINLIYNYSCQYRQGRYELYVQYTE
jgi:hypothetical protein